MHLPEALNDCRKDWPVATTSPVADAGPDPGACPPRNPSLDRLLLLTNPLIQGTLECLSHFLFPAHTTTLTSLFIPVRPRCLSAPMEEEKPGLPFGLESHLGPKAHRISAHRALTLKSNVPKINERHALLGLRTGAAKDNATVVLYRSGHRWRGNEATSLLNDFDFLVQALFADQANKALITHQKNRKGDHSLADPTKLRESCLHLGTATSGSPTPYFRGRYYGHRSRIGSILFGFRSERRRTRRFSI